MGRREYPVLLLDSACLPKLHSLAYKNKKYFLEITPIRHCTAMARKRSSVKQHLTSQTQQNS
jgi:hypothetical protein